MSGSNVGEIAATVRVAIIAGGVALWIWMIWQVSAQYSARSVSAGYRAGEYAKAANKRIERACDRVDRAALTECVAEQIEAGRADQRAEYELKAQQDSADAAFWMMITGVATLFATLLALWFVKRTLDATWRAVDEAKEATGAARDAVSETRRIGEAQTRAYVVVGNFRVSGLIEGQSPRLHYQIKNVGQTPAHDLRVWVEFFWKRSDGVSATDTKVKFHYDKGQSSRAVIGAGEVFDIDLPFGGPLEPVVIEDARANRLKLVAFGVGSYRDIFKKRRLLTLKKYFDAHWLDENGWARLMSCGKGNRSN